MTVIYTEYTLSRLALRGFTLELVLQMADASHVTGEQQCNTRMCVKYLHRCTSIYHRIVAEKYLNVSERPWKICWPLSLKGKHWAIINENQIKRRSQSKVIRVMRMYRRFTTRVADQNHANGLGTAANQSQYQKDCNQNSHSQENLNRFWCGNCRLCDEWKLLNRLKVFFCTLSRNHY
jgi:hypothetical protein